MHPLLQFRNTDLLMLALTHRSYANETNNRFHNNERLEFLGDAILNFLSGEYLYHRYPNIQEDQMTRRRSALVDEKQLAQFAITVGINTKMLLGKGVAREGGYQNENLLSSAFEALVGAYYLDRDCNIDAVRPLIVALFNSLPEEMMAIRSTIDAKNRFQEWAQANIGPAHPRYLTDKVGGTDHAPEFLAKVFVVDRCYGEGRGRNKKEAEKQAAENALATLGQGLISLNPQETDHS